MTFRNFDSSRETQSPAVVTGEKRHFDYTQDLDDRIPYVDRTPLELVILKAGPQTFDGCESCPACLAMLRISLGKDPITSLFHCTACHQDNESSEQLRSIVDGLLRFEITSNKDAVNRSKRALCRYHALHYKLYVHRFNIDTMVSIRRFEDVSKILDDSTVEQIFNNLTAFEDLYESSYTKWIKDLQQQVLVEFCNNIERELACLKASLHTQLKDKEVLLEARVLEVEEEKNSVQGAAEARLQIEMQDSRFKKSKNLLSTYGRIFRGQSGHGNRNLLQLMRQVSLVESNEKARHDEELRHQFHAKIERSKTEQEKCINIWKQKLDHHRKQHYLIVKNTVEKFKKGKKNRIARLEYIQTIEAKKIIQFFRQHCVKCRSLAERDGSTTQTTTLRPITPTIFGYLVTLLKRELPAELQSRTILRDGTPIHDSKVGTVLSQFHSWIEECSELKGLTGREIFALMDIRECGRVTSSDIEAFVRRYNFLIHPSTLFNVIKKQSQGVLTLDDFLLAFRSTELEYEIVLTECLYAAQNRSLHKQRTSDLLNDLEQEQNLAYLRTIAVKILLFIKDDEKYREAKYQSSDDIMFYRIHNFSEERFKLESEAQNWIPQLSPEMKRMRQSMTTLGAAGKGPQLLGGTGVAAGFGGNLIAGSGHAHHSPVLGCLREFPPKSPTEERGGFMKTGKYPCSGPRLTVSPPPTSHLHYHFSNDTSNKFFRENYERENIEIWRRELLYDRHNKWWWKERDLVLEKRHDYLMRQNKNVHHPSPIERKPRACSEDAVMRPLPQHGAYQLPRDDLTGSPLFTPHGLSHAPKGSKKSREGLPIKGSPVADNDRRLRDAAGNEIGHRVLNDLEIKASGYSEIAKCGAFGQNSPIRITPLSRLAFGHGGVTGADLNTRYIHGKIDWSKLNNVGKLKSNLFMYSANSKEKLDLLRYKTPAKVHQGSQGLMLLEKSRSASPPRPGGVGGSNLNPGMAFQNMLHVGYGGHSHGHGHTLHSPIGGNSPGATSIHDQHLQSFQSDRITTNDRYSSIDRSSRLSGDQPGSLLERTMVRNVDYISGKMYATRLESPETRPSSQLIRNPSTQLHANDTEFGIHNNMKSTSPPESPTMSMIEGDESIRRQHKKSHAAMKKVHLESHDRNHPSISEGPSQSRTSSNLSRTKVGGANQSSVAGVTSMIPGSPVSVSHGSPLDRLPQRGMIGSKEGLNNEMAVKRVQTEQKRHLTYQKIINNLEFNDTTEMARKDSPHTKDKEISDAFYSSPPPSPSMARMSVARGSIVGGLGAFNGLPGAAGSTSGGGTSMMLTSAQERQTRQLNSMSVIGGTASMGISSNHLQGRKSQGLKQTNLNNNNDPNTVSNSSRGSAAASTLSAARQSRRSMGSVLVGVSNNNASMPMVNTMNTSSAKGGSKDTTVPGSPKAGAAAPGFQGLFYPANTGTSSESENDVVRRDLDIGRDVPIKDSVMSNTDLVHGTTTTNLSTQELKELGTIDDIWRPQDVSRGSGKRAKTPEKETPKKYVKNNGNNDTPGKTKDIMSPGKTKDIMSKESQNETPSRQSEKSEGNRISGPRALFRQSSQPGLNSVSRNPSCLGSVPKLGFPKLPGVGLSDKGLNMNVKEVLGDNVLGWNMNLMKLDAGSNIGSTRQRSKGSSKQESIAVDKETRREENDSQNQNDSQNLQEEEMREHQEGEHHEKSLRYNIDDSIARVGGEKNVACESHRMKFRDSDTEEEPSTVLSAKQNCEPQLTSSSSRAAQIPAANNRNPSPGQRHYFTPNRRAGMRANSLDGRRRMNSSSTKSGYTKNDRMNVAPGIPTVPQNAAARSCRRRSSSVTNSLSLNAENSNSSTMNLNGSMNSMTSDVCSEFRSTALHESPKNQSIHSRPRSHANSARTNIFGSGYSNGEIGRMGNQQRSSDRDSSPAIQSGMALRKSTASFTNAQARMNQREHEGGHKTGPPLRRQGGRPPLPKASRFVAPETPNRSSRQTPVHRQDTEMNLIGELPNTADPINNSDSNEPKASNLAPPPSLGVRKDVYPLNKSTSINRSSSERRVIHNVVGGGKGTLLDLSHMPASAFRPPKVLSTTIDLNGIPPRPSKQGVRESSVPTKPSS